jgi:hypothetical protein
MPGPPVDAGLTRRPRPSVGLREQVAATPHNNELIFVDLVLNTSTLDQGWKPGLTFNHVVEGDGVCIDTFADKKALCAAYKECDDS